MKSGNNRENEEGKRIRRSQPALPSEMFATSHETLNNRIFTCATDGTSVFVLWQQATYSRPTV